MKENLVQIFGQGFSGRAIEIVAEKVGIGKETLRKAKKNQGKRCIAILLTLYTYSFIFNTSTNFYSKKIEDKLSLMVDNTPSHYIF